MTAITASPSGTASAPPGQKSFCTSTTTSASRLPIWLIVSISAIIARACVSELGATTGLDQPHACPNPHPACTSVAVLLAARRPRAIHRPKTTSAHANAEATTARPSVQSGAGADPRLLLRRPLRVERHEGRL